MGLELGASTFPFDAPGDSVEGEIVSVTEMQATEMDSGLPLYWDAAHTRPKMMPAVELQTTLRSDSADDGRRMVHLSGNRYSAVKRVTRRLDEGAWLKLTFSEYSDREPPKKGYSRAKLFVAEYRPARGGVDLNDAAPAVPTTTHGSGNATTVTNTSAQTSTSVLDGLDDNARAALRALGVPGA